MQVEIEKKFLVINDEFKKYSSSEVYYQGYLCSGGGVTARVRIAGDCAYLTIKGKHSGISRLEFEYAIPVEEARILLAEVCHQPVIHKRRFKLTHEGFTWEIDEFYGDNEGLVLAEIELESEEQPFALPPWVGKEVTQDRRYYNASLRTYPYKEWKDTL